MIAKQPVFGIDYIAGETLFTHADRSVITEGISYFEHLGEATNFGKLIGQKNAEPGHVVWVISEKEGFESYVGGVQKCRLQKYFDDPHCIVVSRTPKDIDDAALQQGYRYAVSRLGHPYDYTGIIGKAIDILTPIESVFPFIRKWPVPLHWPGSAFCSALVADIHKHTDRYAKENIFKKWHVTRISPSIWWNEFCWEPISYEGRLYGHAGVRFSLRRVAA